MNPVSPLIQLVDDDEGVRQGLSLLLGTVGLRVAAWSDPRAFLDGFDRESVGAIVLDVRMPGLSGLTVLQMLREQGADQPVILLTGHGTVDMCRRAFKSGAAEFLEKPVDDDVLLEAVLNGVRAHVQCRERDAAGREARERYAQLSAREREVFSLVVAGLTSKEIARALGMSSRTVETHRAHLGEKLQVQTLAQLIRRYAALADADTNPGSGTA